MTSLINDNRGESDVIWGLYLSIQGDDIFLTLERIEINQPYYTTWLWIMHVLESHFFFRYCGQTAPKFENTVFDLGRARWLIIFNNTLHKERGKIIFNENIKLWLYNSVKKSDHKFLQLYVSAWHNLVKVIIQRKLAVNSNFLFLISLYHWVVKI